MTRESKVTNVIIFCARCGMPNWVSPENEMKLLRDNVGIRCVECKHVEPVSDDLRRDIVRRLFYDTD